MNAANVKLSMRDKWNKLPYDADGDPCFKNLTDGEDCIQGVFTDDEIVILVNRALYAMKYNRETHANRRKKTEETE